MQVEDIQYYFNKGVSYSKEDQYDLAIDNYKKAIEIGPDYSQIYYNLATIYFKTNQYDLAIENFNKALAIDDSSIEIYLNLANTYFNKNDYDMAAKHYQKLLDLNPNDANTYTKLGIIFSLKGDTDKVIWHYQKAFELEPKNAETLYKLGDAFKNKKEIDKAILYYEEALKIKNDSPKFYNNLGITYLEKGNSDKAIRHYQKALELKPDYVLALLNLGNVYTDVNEIDNAINCCQKIIELNYKEANLYNLLGRTLFNKGQLNEAIINYQKAIELEPENSNFYLNLSDAYYSNGEYELAIQYVKKSIELDHDNVIACNNLGILLLLKGEFKKGWKYYEYRLKLRANPYLAELPKPLWDGSSLDGKTIFIQYEQGYGDMIMFARFLPILSKMGAKVIFKPHSGLEQLFRDSEIHTEIIDNSTPVNKLEFDTCQMIMSLPHFLNIDENNIPSKDKYLRANPEKVKDYKEKYFNNNDFKIGIIWQCRNVYPKDIARSISYLSDLFPITKLSGVKVYSLQKGKGEKQLENLPDNVNIVSLGHTFKDFSDTAAAIENLDLVISVDTSVPHLSAALGKKTFLLIEHFADWKWLEGRDDSIWYDNMRLFRQNSPNNWASAITQVVEYLEKKFAIAS